MYRFYLLIFHVLTLPALFAQDFYDTPITNYQTFECNCQVVDGGVSAYPSTTSGSFEVELPACGNGSTPTIVAAYLNWYDRFRSQSGDLTTVPTFDTQVEISINGTTLNISPDATFDALLDAGNRNYYRVNHIADISQDFSFNTGANTISFDNWNLPPENANNKEHYGIALTLLYECADLPYKIVNFQAGLDWFYFDGNDCYEGEVSDMVCAEFPVSCFPRTIDINGIIGGQKNASAPFRGHRVFYKVGTGTPPSSDYSDDCLPDPIVVNDPTGEFEPNSWWVSDLGTEWDEVEETVTLPAGKTWICLQALSTPTSATGGIDKGISGDMLAPSFCIDACDLKITGVTPSACDPDTDTYSLAVTIAYQAPPCSDLEITADGNTKSFSVNGSGSQTFTLTNLPANGNTNVSINAFFNAACNVNYSGYNAPTSCGAPPCSIDDALISNILCLNRNTLSDPSDDKLRFDLEPTGVSLSEEGYTISVDNGSILPTSGSYGTATTFTMNAGSAGGGNVTVTITDITDPTCSFDVVVNDPGSCSGICNLMDSGLSNIQCADNSTTTDNTDDIITFELNPTGGNLGTTYSITASSGTITPNNANYGNATTFALDNGTAGNGDVVIIITDDNDASCSLYFTVADPGSCSSSCAITQTTIVNTLCGNVNTLADASDDRITFRLNIDGFNLSSTGYTLTATQGGNPISLFPDDQGDYGISSFFRTANGGAGQGDIDITITDNDNAACQANLTISDPGTCSDGCSINDAGLGLVQCLDNSTNYDANDDIIEFELNPTGSGTAATYTITSNIGTPTPNTGSYGTPITVSLGTASAGQGNVTISIFDDANATCVFDVEIPDTGTCSPECLISDAGLGPITCLDGGTPADASDDQIQFILNPTGFSIAGSTYTVTNVSGGTVTPTSAAYGIPTVFTLDAGTAGAGDVLITIIDDNKACTFDVTLTDPGSCSDACSITDFLLENIICSAGGTADEERDDRIFFDLTVNGNNTAAKYLITATQNGVPVEILPAQYSYGVLRTFRTPIGIGVAGYGDLEVTVTDLDDPNCEVTFTVTDPDECSVRCGFFDTEVLNSTCLDNGTTNDPTDDIIEFTVQVAGFNVGTLFDGTGVDEYTVSINDGTLISNSPTGPFAATATGIYGVVDGVANPETFYLENASAGSGEKIITITDTRRPANEFCFTELTLPDPDTCSPDCQILDVLVTSVSCLARGGRNAADPTDDGIQFRLDPQGYNLVGNYTIEAIQGGSAIPSTDIRADNIGDYGAQSLFRIYSNSVAYAGGGDITVTVTDNNNVACTFEVTIPDPGQCSPDITLNKTFVSATEQTDGSFEVIYTITVDNVNGFAATNYALIDSIFFDDDIIVNAVSYTTDAAGNAGEGTSIDLYAISATSPWQLAFEQNIGIGDTHTYTLTFNISLDLSNGSGGDDTYDPCGTIDPATPQKYEGLFNKASLDITSDETTDLEDDDCGDIDIPCTITITDSTVGVCNDNGTTADASDDTFDVTVNATAVNGGTQFTVSNDATLLGTFDYATGGTIIGLPADGSTITLTFADATDNTCIKTVDVSQISCSNDDLCLPTRCLHININKN